MVARPSQLSRWCKKRLFPDKAVRVVAPDVKSPRHSEELALRSGSTDDEASAGAAAAAVAAASAALAETLVALVQIKDRASVRSAEALVQAMVHAVAAAKRGAAQVLTDGRTSIIVMTAERRFNAAAMAIDCVLTLHMLGDRGGCSYGTPVDAPLDRLPKAYRKHAKSDFQQQPEMALAVHVLGLCTAGGADAHSGAGAGAGGAGDGPAASAAPPPPPETAIKAAAGAPSGLDAAAAFAPSGLDAAAADSSAAALSSAPAEVATGASPVCITLTHAGTVVPVEDQLRLDWEFLNTQLLQAPHRTMVEPDSLAGMLRVVRTG